MAIACCLVSFSAPLSAQARAGFGAWIDASGARIEQPSQPRREAAFFGLGAVRAGRLLSLAAQASLTSARDSAGAGQADFVAQFAPPRMPRLRTDIALSAVSYGWRAGSDRGGAVELRESFDWTLVPVRMGVFATAARGGTTRRDMQLVNAFTAVATSAGMRVASGPFTLSAEWRRALSDDYALAEAAGYGLRRYAASFDYRDVLLSGGVRWERLDADVVHSRRRGGTATTGRSTATSATATVALTSRVALVASTGRHLADPLRGIAAADVSSVGLRLALGGGSRATATRAARGSAGDIVITAQSPGYALVTVRVPAHDADRVQVATSYGEWTPLEMERDGAWRVARIEMPSGTHRIAIRVNDGMWRAPRGTVAVRDDFGGTAGILIVP